MKKTALWLVLCLLSFYLVSCDLGTYDEEIETIEAEIKSIIPEAINSDYILPVFENYQINWKIDDQVYEDTYVYQSPKMDEDMVFNVTIKRGFSSKTFEVTSKRLSLTLANYKTSLYISMDDSISNINLDTYMNMSVDVISELNGSDQFILNNESGRIRGRGNSTWYSYPKKPYKLKFDERVSILGMPHAKTYVLLAEYADPSLMRNVITHELSTYFNLRHTLETRYVDLYINNQYLGVYVLTEQVEVDKNKLDLTIDADINDLSFFLELDMRYVDYPSVSPNAWISMNQTFYEIKDLDPEDLTYTLEYRNHIQSYLYDAYNHLISNDYTEYIDIDAWIDYMIVQEITKNVDNWYSSVYLFKDKGGRLTFGPLWDFDFAYGNVNYIEHTPIDFYGLRSDKNIWFHEMMQIPEVREKFKERYMDFYDQYKDQFLLFINRLYMSLIDESARDDATWDRLGLNVWPNPEEMVDAYTFQMQYNYLYQFVGTRLNWLYNAMQTDEYDLGLFDQI